MKKQKTVETLIFDFDGTIHETHYIYQPALQKGIDDLAEKKAIDGFTVTDTYASSFLGDPPKEAWKKIAPSVEEDLREQAMNLVGQAMIDYMEEGRGQLFDGAKKVLEELKNRGYDLILVSNATLEYLKSARKVYDLDRYFSRITAAQEYFFLGKEVIFKDIKNGIRGDVVVIGDRFHDMEGAEKNQMDTVFCRYGYGEEEEGNRAIYKIDSIEEILEIF